MSNEASSIMEKQLVRHHTQLQSKNNGSVSEKRNDFPPNRNGRQRRGKDPGNRSQEASTPRSVQKWGRFTDKRPRQRGYYDDRCREEVTEEEDSSFGEEPYYASNSRKGNGNHLLSFQYERRGAQHGNFSRYKGPSSSSQRQRYKTGRFNKDQFLQASYQFVVRGESDMGQWLEQTINPDALVSWDLVELVIHRTPEEIHCSICLMPPMAGKTTKCGHTYCWACILHYLSTEESGRQGCPLCHQVVASDELRSIQHIQIPRYKEGEVIEMKLMKKKKGSVYVSPRAEWKDKEGQPLNLHDGVATAFNKVLVATSAQIYSEVLEAEKAALTVQMVEAEDYETGYIVMAQDLLRKRELDLKERIRRFSSCSSVPEEEEKADLEEEGATAAAPPPPPLAPHQSFDGTQITTTYADAFEDAEEETETNSMEEIETKSVEEESIPFETLYDDEDDSTNEVIEKFEESSLDDKSLATPMLTPPPTPGVNNPGHFPEEVQMTAVEAAYHLELPSEHQPGGVGGATGGARRANQSKDVYYFYQASSGQHVYLNSLNVQCLVREYGSLEDSPDTIAGTVVAIDRIFINEEMRKRFRYLNHIPLTCEIQIVELKLASPIVSKDTIKAFQGEFEKRRKMRQRKLKAEKLRAKTYEAEQRKKAHEYYHGYTIVRSEQYQPPQSPQDMPSPSATGGEASSPGEEESTSPTTRSFAQIIKNSNRPGVVSPSGPGFQSAWPRMVPAPQPPKLQQAEEEDDEESRPPSYAASMFQAWDKVNFRTPPPAKAAPPTKQTNSGGKKKKKKDGMQVLFSTSMARKN